ncbi:MAG: hypothetical protein K2Y28_15340 [Burkholderiaceae bacterium]|nr:hypothetical protein [Burkholderiaceae bacterium]
MRCFASLMFESNSHAAHWASETLLGADWIGGACTTIVLTSDSAIPCRMPIWYANVENKTSANTFKVILIISLMAIKILFWIFFDVTLPE